MHNLWLLIFLFIALAAVVFLIMKRWVMRTRGFTQLSVFIIGEITLFCNKGAPCSNCPLSFGICPIGTTQRLAFIRDFPFPITLVFIAITGLLFGSLSCGWACPVGFMQDLLHMPRKKEIKIANKFNAVRCFILLLFILLIYLELRLLFLSKMGISIFHEFTIVAGAMLLCSAIFIKRPLCRMFCPLGFIYGKLNKINLIKFFHRKKCFGCSKCAEACVVNIQPSREFGKDLCTKCFNCKRLCPGA